MIKNLYLIILFIVFSMHAYADESAGTWKFEKAKEYFGNMTDVPAPKNTIIQIVNNKLAISSICFTALEKENYYFSEAFQSLMKDGGEEKGVAEFLDKNFSFALPQNSYFQISDVKKKCLTPFSRIFFFGNRLITVFGGSLFYSYTRVINEEKKSKSANIELYDYKLSQLPFFVSNFVNLCDPLIFRLKGVPQTSEKCAPVYYPYTISKKENNPLAKLIGGHNYTRGGARHADDYDNPSANDLHPTFMIFPPFEDVLLMRVNDLELGKDGRGESMAGVYLTIKDGKVVDQVNDGCDINTEYFCIGDDGSKQYQLLENGKFKKLN